MSATITCPDCGHDRFEGPVHRYYTREHVFTCSECGALIKIREQTE